LGLLTRMPSGRFRTDFYNETAAKRPYINTVK